MLCLPFPSGTDFKSGLDSSRGHKYAKSISFFTSVHSGLRSSESQSSTVFYDMLSCFAISSESILSFERVMKWVSMGFDSINAISKHFLKLWTLSEPFLNPFWTILPSKRKHHLVTAISNNLLPAYTTTKQLLFTHVYISAYIQQK